MSSVKQIDTKHTFHEGLQKVQFPDQKQATATGSYNESVINTRISINRGHDANEVNCAMEMMREPLKPFSFGAPYNLNPTTKEYSRPEDAFDYQAHFNYEYDKLELQGMDVARLQNYINERKVGNTVRL